MAQDVARGNLPQARVFADIVITRQILVERLVQVEFARVEEFQDRVSEDRLAQTRGFKDRVVGDRLIRLCILHAEAVAPDQFGVAQQRDRKTRHVAVFHQLGDALFKLSNQLLFRRLRLQRIKGRFRSRLFLSESRGARNLNH